MSFNTKTNTNILPNSLDDSKESILTSKTSEIKDLTRNILNWNSELLELCNIKPNYWRIYLLRHLPLIKDEKYLEYEKLKQIVTENWLSNINKDLFIELEDNLSTNPELLSEDQLFTINSIFINWDSDTNIKLYCDNSDNTKKRITETIEWIKSTFPNINEKKEIYFPWSDKKMEMFDALINSWKHLSDSLNYVLNQNEIEWQTLVILWNRSYSSWFDLKSWNRDISINESEKNFENNWYSFIDIDSTWKQIRDDKLLVITPKNYSEIARLFNLDEKNIPIINLQNWLNLYFQKHPELFKKFLLDENIQNNDILLFCIYNLLNWKTEWWVNAVEEFLINEILMDAKNLLEIFKLIFNNSKISDETKLRLAVRIKLLANINLVEKAWVSSKYEDNANSECKSIVDLKNNTEKWFNAIFENSLDPLINSWENLLENHFYILKEISEDKKKLLLLRKKNQWIEAKLNSSELFYKFPIELNEILNNPEGKTVHIITSHVGNGKSIEMANICKKLINDNQYNNEYLPLFYSKFSYLKTPLDVDKLKIKIKEDILLMKRNFPKKKIIIFFDWLDEIEWEYRYIMTEFLMNITKKGDIDVWELWTSSLFIWARTWIFEQKENSSFDIIWFKTLDEKSRNEYIRSRLISSWIETEDLDKKIIEIDNFVTSNKLSPDIKDTKLILYFLCKLSVDNSFSEIKNRADIYEKIVRMILIKHNWQKWIPTNSILINNSLDYLSECAYKIDKWIEFDSNSDYNQILAILFKQNNEWKYDFIHSSFKEYFLARYLSNNVDWNKIIANELESFTEFDSWKEFESTLDFYWEILINDNKVDLIDNFLDNNNWFREEVLLNRDSQIIENWKINIIPPDPNEFFLELYGTEDQNCSILYFLKWLEILIKSDSNNIESKNMYFEKLKSFSAIEITENIEFFWIFSKNLWFKDNIYSNYIVDLLSSLFDYSDSIFFPLLSILISIWTPKALKIVFDKINSDACNYISIDNIFDSVINLWTPDAILTASRFVVLIIDKELYNIWDKYIILDNTIQSILDAQNSWTQKAIENIIDIIVLRWDDFEISYIENFFSSGQLIWYSNYLYNELNSKSIFLWDKLNYSWEHYTYF